MLSLVFGKGVGTSAENAACPMLFQDNRISIDENFNRVALLDSENLSELDWENNSSEVVYFSDNSGFFHMYIRPL